MRIALLLLCCFAAGVPHAVHAQTATRPPLAGASPPAPPTQATGEKVSLEQIQARKSRIGESTDLDQATKDQALELLGVAESRLRDAESFATETARSKQLLDGGPPRIKEVEAALATPPPPPEAIPQGLSIQDLEQRLLKRQAEAAAQKSRMEELSKTLSQLQTRPSEAREQLAEAQRRLQAIEDEVAASPTDEPPVLADLRKLAQRARRQARQAEIESLQQELLSYEVRVHLTTAERDLTAREQEATSAAVLALDTALGDVRRAEAQEVKTETERVEREAETKHPVIQRLAKENADLGREVADVVAELENMGARTSATAGRATQVGEDLDRARQALEIAGLSEGLGRILREQRRTLPDLQHYRRASVERQALIAEAGIRGIEIGERQRQLRDVPKAVARLMNTELDDATPPGSRDIIETELNKLLSDQVGLLEKASRAYTSYTRALVDLDFEERQLVDKALAFAAFLDERLIWIPNAKPLGPSLAPNTAAAAAWLFSPAQWSETLHTLVDRASGEPLSVVALLLIAVLVRFRGRLSGKWGGAEHRYRFGVLAGEFALTVVRASPGPLALVYAGWLLTSASKASEHAVAVGAGLLVSAHLLFFFIFMRMLGAPEGLGVHRLNWDRHVTARLVRDLRRLARFLLPGLFIAYALAAQGDGFHNTSLGRIAFLIAMAAAAAFNYRTLHPQHGIPAGYLQRHGEGWISKLRWAWYWALVGLPVAVLVLAAFGYYFTALELGKRAIFTLYLLIGFAIVQELVVHWLVIAERRLARRKAREQRELEAMRESSAAQPETSLDGIEEPDVDLQTVNAQTRELLYTAIGIAMVAGIWLVWSPVLPALGLLSEVQLWHTTQLVDGADVVVPVTLWEVAVALVALAIVVVAARNLPGALEILLLQRLPVGAGVRYAVTSMCQYVIVAAGVFTVLGILGVRWSSLQWLVAALSVGLGFGLQEIVANFVSGIIILFERPMRIGDTVTIAELSGTVTRIRIRATTIRNWDRQEIIVPNKTFITDRLINWTLTDPINRITIPVGVSYGSDPRRVREVIYGVITSNPLVLEEPPPGVFFLGFGESALDFEARIFVKDLGDFMPARHDLHTEIFEALREHGIEIPFPQRDVHVRSTVAPQLPLADEPPRQPERGTAPAGEAAAPARERRRRRRS